MSVHEKVGEVLELVGQTPLMLLTSLSTEQVRYFAKLESYNPGGSLQDRLVLQRVARAREAGALVSDSIMIDTSNDEHAISAAMVGAALGVAVHCIVDSQVNPMVIQLARALGAKIDPVVLLPSLEESKQARVERAHALMRVDSRFCWLEAFPATELEDGLVVELIEALEGQLDYFLLPHLDTEWVSSCARTLMRRVPHARVLSVDWQASGPAKRRVGDGTHEQVTVTEEQGRAMCRQLLEHESLLVGPGSGAVLHAALQVGRVLPAASTPLNVVMVLPEHGDRHLPWLRLVQEEGRR